MPNKQISMAFFFSSNRVVSKIAALSSQSAGRCACCGLLHAQRPLQSLQPQQLLLQLPAAAAEMGACPHQSQPAHGP